MLAMSFKRMRPFCGHGAGTLELVKNRVSKDLIGNISLYRFGVDV